MVYKKPYYAAKDEKGFYKTSRSGGSGLLIKEALLASYIGARDRLANSDNGEIVTVYLKEEVKLEENEKIVLDWLMIGQNAPFALIAMLDDDFTGIETPFPIPSKVWKAFEALDDKQQFQVLAAFAERKLSEVAK